MRRVAYAYMTGRCVRVASRRVASHFLWPRIAPLLSVRPFKSVRSMCPHTHHISRTPFFSRSESVTHPNPSHCPRLVRPTTNLPTYRHTLATASRSTLAPTSCCCCFALRRRCFFHRIRCAGFRLGRRFNWRALELAYLRRFGAPDALRSFDLHIF